MISFKQRLITLLLILSLLFGVSTTVLAQSPELSNLANVLQSIRSLVNNLAAQIQGTTQTAAVATNNLVAYYSFDEGTGSTANDTSGNSNHGTINGASWTTGISGNALSFDGINDFVETVANISTDIGDTSHSISLWVKPTVTSGTRSILFRAPSSLNLRMSGNGLVYTRSGAGYTHHQTTNANINTQAWHHIVVVYDTDNTNVSIYVDNVQKADDFEWVYNHTKGSNSIYIGSNNSNSYFNGSLDELRIYNRALSASEVQDLYNDPGQGGGGSAPAPTPDQNPTPSPDPTPTPGDTTPPTLSGGSPTGTLSSGTTNVTLRITTNENAVCKYSTSAAASYFSMNGYSSTGGTTHTANISNLQPGQSYTYYTKCQDTNSNTSSNYTTSFSIPASTPTPVPDPGPAPAPDTIPGVRPAPDWVRTLPVGEFKAINTNYVKDVAASADPQFGYRYNGAPWSSTEGLSGITDDWNGGALASNYGEAGALLVWGGGHGGYGGSDVYGFDLDDLEWKRLSNPYGSIPGGPLPGHVISPDGRFPDGSPIPYHTGDHVEYLPETNDFVVMGSADNFLGIDGPDVSFHLLNLDHLTADNYEHTAFSSPWRFSGLLKDKMHIEDIKDKVIKDPESYYGGTCYDRNRKFLWWVQVPGVIDYSTRTQFLNWFVSYDPNVLNADGTVGRIETHDVGPGGGFNTMEAACDPKRDIFVLTNLGNSGEATFLYYKDLKNPSAVEKSLDVGSVFPQGGVSRQHAFEYSDVRDSMIFYDDANLKEVWEFKIEDDPSGGRNFIKGTWNQISTGGGPIPDFNGNDVFSRFRIAKFNLDGKLVEVAVMVNNVGEQPGEGDVWAFRIPGEGDVVNTTPYVPGQNPTPAPAQPSDSTPPTVRGGTPDGTLPVGTTNTVMRVTTNESASCRYSTNSGTNYNSMSPYSTTGGTSHSVTVSSLQNGQSYSYYTKCRDSASNVSNDYAVSFSVLAPTSSPTPSPSPSPVTPPGAFEDRTFDEKCAGNGVQICHRFKDPATVAEYYVQSYAKVPAEWDPIAQAGKLTIPGKSAGDTTGTFWIDFDTFDKNTPGMDQYWMQYKLYLTDEVIELTKENGTKYAIAFHLASCGGDEFAHTGGSWPGYYETCGANGYTVRNPAGDNPFQYDFQPGGGSSCLYNNAELPGRPCFIYQANKWLTFTSHLDLSGRVARVWAQYEGEDPVKIIEHQLYTIDQVSSLFIGPYMGTKDATIDHPDAYLWVQDIIISKDPIAIGSNVVTGPAPVTPTPAPTPTPVPPTFETNDNVKINISGTLNVRATANGTVLGQQTDGRVGTVIGGPVESGSNTWYQVNFTEGVDGWVSEDFIEAYSGTLPSPTPTPNPTPQPTPTPGGGGSTPPPTSGGSGGTPSSGGSTNTGGTVGGGVVTPTVGSGDRKIYTFTRNLRIGSRGDDVKQLQKFLNDRGYTISTTGVGSKGNESSYFGQKTAEALKKFQNDHKAEVLTPNNLTRGNGYFGASTRSKVNELYTTIASTNGGVINTDIDTTGQTNAELEALIAQLLEQVAQLTAQLNARSGGTTVTSPTTRFTRTLRLGSRGEDVRRLQQFLNQDPATQISGTTGGSPGRETAYFGKKTEDALKRYQAKHGIVSSGTPSTTGYGVLGPRTRGSVNR